MDASTSSPSTRRPLPLLRNIRYPSYQLWAIAGNAGNRDATLKIAVLHTMDWLRQRFREHVLPDELKFPPAEDYDKVSFSDFANVHLQQGYRLDIIWLMDVKSWSLQLTEPDLGPQPGEQAQKRPPLAGRIFETDISFQQTEEGVLCGFQTMVSEPEKTEVRCEVYRSAVVKRLKRDPLAGLRHIWRLEEKPHAIETASGVNKFSGQSRRNERILPIVVVCEYAAASTAPKPASVQDAMRLAVSDKPLVFNVERYLLNRNASGAEHTELPEWVDTISYDRMGYAHFFVLSADMREEFIQATDHQVENGGVLVLPSPQTAEPVISFSHREVNDAQFHEKLDDLISSFLREKKVDFSHCTFVPQAQDIYSDSIHQRLHSAAELEKHYEAQIERIRERNSKDQAEIESGHFRERRKLESALSGEAEKRGTLEERANFLAGQLAQRDSDMQSAVERLQMLRNRPVKTSDICDWAQQSFCSRLELHDRAKQLMKDAQKDDVDVGLLCDALEFLAYEHWDKLNGRIDENEYNSRASRYFGRPFEVVRSSDESIQRYPEEYTVKYSKNGQAKDEKLIWHLKIGTDSKRLVRVYFFYDKEARKIVVGSMPKHLPVVSVS